MRFERRHASLHASRQTGKARAVDIWLVIALVTAALLAVALAVVLLRLAGAREESHRLGDAVASVAAQQAELAGRLKQIADSDAATAAQLAERLQAQERAISKALEDRLADLSKRVGDNLTQNATKTFETVAELKERLVAIDAAQKNIAELSGQVVGLQDILSNKQARGAFGEIQLQDLVLAALPPSAYEFQATLGNGRRADCLIKLPNPPGAIVVDAKFPLESYRALVAAPDDAAREAARRAFTADVLKHVRDIAERYIVPGETAESALMFLPSEAVYAELHANFADVVDKSYKARVWIVSPTTLMATLNTVRAVLKDARMREQAGLIQKEVMTMLEDLKRLDQRVANLQKHFEQASEDVRQIRISADKVAGRGERIGEMELDEDGGAVLPGTGAQIHRIESSRG
jgi:DNA recombination protein RmuC